MKAYASSSVSLELMRSYWTGSSDATRLAAMGLASLAHRRVSRDVPAGLDLIHYPVTVPIPKVHGLPSVVSLADVQHHDMPELFSSAERAYRRWAYDGAARAASEVITISEFSAARLVEKLGIEPERVHAIPLGIDHSRFNANAPMAEVPGLPGRYIYYPANAWPHKNHALLFEALSRLADPDMYLVLTGHGQEPMPGDEARRIVRLGRIPESDIPGLYRGATALVFPSLYEGFGFPPLEAMACGCPVAASHVGAVAEACGDAALLFDPTDAESITAAIARITADNNLRTQLRAAGLTRASQFTWKRTAQQHLSVYREALERRS